MLAIARRRNEDDSDLVAELQFVLYVVFIFGSLTLETKRTSSKLRAC